ncbi:radical SAM protein [Streptomyces sp. SL13]|uniref:Radical SAM protein n=1 Tax=Streptantibioticus silvisoli TaxID=2705255 RepID=A0AA90HB21_9ACTN|nr:radical SAM protein [Streptantibioticus silvisoli]MDI5973534.1 radical SAM protein [Streptantibioticus silvisoli]
MMSADLSGVPGPPPAAAGRRQVHLVELTVMPGVRYSAVLGYLQAAAEAVPTLAAACSFTKHVHLQGADVFEITCAAVLGALQDPLAVAFSVYFWNRPGTLELARRIKERWPRCRIVIGGNDVTHQQGVFAEAPWVDVLVHGEGELRFRDLLGIFLRHEGSADGELAALPGISFRSASGEVVTTAAAPRIANLGELPSPLLGDTWTDEDIARSRMLVYETNRGCPYSCAFCYWGGATNTRVRQFPTERIRDELERIVRVAADGTQLFIADANFGIVARDVDIARHLVDLCRRYGKRLLVMTNWAKNTNGRVVEIAGILYRAGLTGAVTLSAQSFDADVLQIANRRNIRVDNYRRMQAQFRSRDIPTYTDLIWGLPGESLATHLAGIEEVIASGGSPVVYPLLLLNNTDYTHDRFRDDHGLRTGYLPCDPGNTDLMADVVTGHSRMTFEDWLAGMVFRIPLTLFHKCLLRATLRVLAEVSGVRTVDLLEMLGPFLGAGGAGDPLVSFLLADYVRAWRDPAGVSRERLQAYAGHPLMSEEIHYQAILRRVVGEESRAAHCARAAVDFLYGMLTSLGHSLPDRATLDMVTQLDLAATAIFRAGIHGKTERHDLVLPETLFDLLSAYGDVPAGMSESVSTQGLLSVRIEVPESRTRYPFSAYALSVWHGSGRPLHDVDLRLGVGRLPTGRMSE